MELSKKPEFFVSSCTRTLDEKSRVSLPARFRTQLERSQKEYDAIYVFCLPHRKEIRVYTYDGWLEFAQPKIDAIEDPRERMAMAEQIYALLDEQTVDSQGRLKIDKSFLKAIEVDKSVRISGNGRGLLIKAASEETNIFNISEKTADFMDNLTF